MTICTAETPVFPLPSGNGTTVVKPPGTGFGNWAGSPSAVRHDGTTYLAYCMRSAHTPGSTNVIGKSTNGTDFETIAILTEDGFGAGSLERPALVVTPDGRWRLYVSCATPGTKHWRVDVLEASTPEEIASASPVTTLPGDDLWGVKDPVIVIDNNGIWHLWASCHPLDIRDAEDRMVTNYAVSPDGLEWNWKGAALKGRPDKWDSRGVRFTSVLWDRPTPVAYYDGRASAEENFEERTGVAFGDDEGRFEAQGDEPAAESPHGGKGLRYLSIVTLENDRYGLYYEWTDPDGSHELRYEEA